MEYSQEGINLIYGGEATGKTTLALIEMAKFLKENKKVVFLDTEASFSIERFKQIYGEGCDDAIINLFLINVVDFKDQKKKFRKIEKLDNVDLVIVDSLGSHYRKALTESDKKANKEIHIEMNILKALNCKGSKILLTNHVYSKLDEGRVEMVGSSMVRNWANTLIELGKDEHRYCKVLKPVQEEFNFDIVNEGIKFFS